MKSTFSLLTATLIAVFASTTLAIQSKPFYLVLHSSNSSLDGKALDSCHEGAAIEGLCVSSTLAKAKPAYQTYQFNTTNDTPNYGILTWTLVGGNFKESEGMSLYVDASTNTAIALFEPSETFQFVSFDANNRMFIKSYYDDTVSPPKEVSNPQLLYRWYACQYNFDGYLYEVLAWVYGSAPPQNPTCQKVGVERVFHK